jgi:hypothetical protein
LGPLPNRRPDRTWAGPSAGADCAICHRPVPQGELEFEVDFDRDGTGVDVDTYHLHASCYRAWRSREEAQPVGTGGNGRKASADGS